ncbi:MAG: hypothetical protein M3317_12300 [Actinomycetota bacterium]|nr:hypothetical protein [Actinomycetota bacterium]
MLGYYSVVVLKLGAERAPAHLPEHVAAVHQLVEGGAVAAPHLTLIHPPG